MALRQRVSLLVAPLVPAAKVEVEIVVAEVETKASTLAQETVVVAAARARRRVHGRLVPWRGEAAPRPLPLRDYALCSRQISGRPMQDCRAKDGRNSNEDDDAGARPVLTSPRRPSTEMPDEHAAQGTIAPTTVAAGAERRELDETGTVPHAGASPRRPSTEMPG